MLEILKDHAKAFNSEKTYGGCMLQEKKLSGWSLKTAKDLMNFPACRAPDKVQNNWETCYTIVYDKLLLSCSDFSGLRKFPE